MTKTSTYPENMMSPYVFPKNRELFGYDISYHELVEFAQGSPSVGSIFINHHKVDSGSGRFGAPFFGFHGHIIIPIRLHSFLAGWGFKLCAINLSTSKMNIFGKTYPYIHIKEIEENTVFFYTKNSERPLHNSSHYR